MVYADAKKVCVAGLVDCLKKTTKVGGYSALYQGFGVSVQVPTSS